MIDKIFLALIGLLIFIVMPWSVAMVIACGIAESDCLAKGYPSAKVDWKFNAYCVNYEFREAIKK